MAATNFTPISLYYSTTAATAPTAGNLVNGELAINITDGKLYYKDNAGVVQTLATKDATSGSFTNLSYTGTLTGGTGVVNLGSGQFYKDASGLVGIGTSSPQTRLQLDITGSNAAAATSVGTFQINQAGVTSLVGSSGIEFKCSTFGSGYGSKVTAFDDGSLIFANRASSATWSERMRIDSSGNVSIGNTSAQAKLHVTQATAGATVANLYGVAGKITVDFNGTGYSYLDGASFVYRTFAGVSRAQYDFSSANTVHSLYAGATGYVSSVLNSTSAGYLIYQTNSTETGRMVVDSSSNIIFSNTSSVTERMRIDSSGNVGIGTSSPTTRLSFGAYIPANGQTISVYENGNTRSGFGVVSGVFRHYTDTGSVQSFGQVDTADGATYYERMRIDSSGRVGIGTSSPAQKFVVSENGVNFVTSVGGGVQFVGTTTNSSMALITNSSESLRITDTGNIGIFTTSPYANSLTLAGTKWGIFRGNIGGVTPPSNEGILLGWNASAGGGDANIVWGTYFTNAAPLTFSSTNGSTLTERMRITAAGDVGMGTTAPLSRLEIRDALTATRLTVTNTNNAAAGAGVNFLVLNGGSTVGNGTIRTDNADNLAFFNLGGERMRITSIGNLLLGATSQNSATVIGIQNGDGFVERDYSNNGGSYVTVTVAGTFNYLFEITAMAVGNSINNQISEGRWIAGRRDYAGSNHIYSSASLVGSGITFTTTQTIVGNQCTYSLKIQNSLDASNNHWIVKVRVKNNDSFSITYT